MGKLKAKHPDRTKSASSNFASSNLDSFNKTSSQSQRENTKYRHKKRVETFLNWTKDNCKQLKANNTDDASAKLGLISADDLKTFFDYISHWREGDRGLGNNIVGSKKTFSVPESYKSALIDFYLKRKISFPDGFLSDLKTFLAGIKVHISI